MGCFGEKKKKKRKGFPQVRYGTVRYTMIPIFLSFVYTEKKKYQQGGGRDVFFVLSPRISLLHKVCR